MKTDNPAFAAVDLLTAELEIDSSIYKGFAAAIMVKAQPRMIALCREYADAVQLMAIIDASRTPADADRVRIAVEALEEAGEALESAASFIIKKWGTTNPARERAIGTVRQALAALKSEGK